MGAGAGNGPAGTSRVTVSGHGKGNGRVMEKSLDRKLAAIHADPSCREFIIADAKDADMALGIGAPGRSPEMHAGEVRFKTLEEYRDQMRLITRSGLVDIMLMSASSNHALTFRERLFDESPVTPAVRANDTTDIHLARGASYHLEPSRPFRTASIDHIQCGHLDCAPEERTQRGQPRPVQRHLQQQPRSRPRDARATSTTFAKKPNAKAFATSSRSSTPNVQGRVAARRLAGLYQRHDHADAGRRRRRPAGRCSSRWSITARGRWRSWSGSTRTSSSGILGGSAGTTRDAFQLLHDAQKYGAKVALFGRKINNAENQLAFVHFLRLIVEGQIGSGGGRAGLPRGARQARTQADS